MYLVPFVLAHICVLLEFFIGSYAFAHVLLVVLVRVLLFTDVAVVLVVGGCGDVGCFALVRSL